MDSDLITYPYDKYRQFEEIKYKSYISIKIRG